MREVEIEVLASPAVCTGVLASYVCRRIAFRAGAYAPGIDEAVFHELHRPSYGTTIDDVGRWFLERRLALAELGYRLACRRFESTGVELVQWLRAGRGYRGVLLVPSQGAPVAISVERAEADADDEVVLTDLTTREIRRRITSTPNAVEGIGEAALAVHWSGCA